MIVGATVAALVASGSSWAARVSTSDIDSVVKSLDLTSFPNSVGPRQVSGKTTFADYGFINVERTDSGAILTTQDQGWEMSFSILSTHPHSLRMCFYDRGLVKPGDVRAPSYNATSALVVTKEPQGMWTARQVRAGFPGCRNDPMAA